jgi:hypothetical protein
MKTIVFLNTKEGSPDKYARLDKMSNGNYHVVNFNMPYLGTINEIWTEKELQTKLKNKEILIQK